MNMEMLELHRNHFDNILKERHDQPFKRILDHFKVTYTYDAISLEGHNRIPFEDVKRLVELKSLLSYSEREQKEVLNHVKAFEKILDMVEHHIELDEERLKDLHEILVSGIFQGGVYRNVNIQMMGSQHQPTDHAKVYDRMHKLFQSLETETFDHALDKAMHMHAGIAKIHPFLDANGRLARLVLNYYLLKAGYVCISIPVQDKEVYIQQLEIFKSDKNIKPLKQYMIHLLSQTYESFIHQLDI
jgi:Fic family protein